MKRKYQLQVEMDDLFQSLFAFSLKVTAADLPDDIKKQ